MTKYLTAPASWLYAAGVWIRNLLYDIGALPSRSHSVPVVCVGNITVGGTGKTPMVEFILSSLESEMKVAVLSRGYGRSTRGFREVTLRDSYLTVGDEPRQIKLGHPSARVFVCEDRNKAVETIMDIAPETELILMDDGFQHRSIRPSLNIVLLDYTRLPNRDRFLPRGSLRDSVRQLRRADLIAVGKVPQGTDSRSVIAEIPELARQVPSIVTSISYGELRPMFPDGRAGAPQGPAVVFSAIGNPAPFEQEVASRMEVAGCVRFGDHHRYRVADIRTLRKRVETAGNGAVLVTTVKDAVKIADPASIPEDLRARMLVLPMKTGFPDNDSHIIINEIRRCCQNR